MSTGLPTLAAAGKNEHSASRVAALSGGSSRWFASHASAARMAGPPAFVRMATACRVEIGWCASSAATSNILFQRISADDARVTEQRFDDDIARRQRSGV
jgi:hypothetical protein